jgi:hypothetical protein
VSIRQAPAATARSGTQRARYQVGDKRPRPLPYQGIFIVVCGSASLALACSELPAPVRWHPLQSAAIVTQLVTHRLAGVVVRLGADRLLRRADPQSPGLAGR